MNLLYQSAFLKALGWALLNSLWQMALLWLVYVGLTMNGKKLLSRQRHAIALLLLTGGSLWFLISLIINFYKAASGPQVITLYVTETDPALSNNTLPGIISHWFEPALPFLSLAYLVAAAFLFVRFYLQYRHTQRLFTTGLKKADAEWRLFLQQAVQHMSIKKKVQIWLSSLVDTPVTLGIIKPVILLPVAAVNHLTLKQVEAIILHELNHIRRNDYLVNLLISCVDVILFFNPFARQLTGIIRKERENCCDDMVLQFCYEPHSYATALLKLEQSRTTTNELALAATGKDKHFLLNRVKRILGTEPESTPFNQKMIAYLLSALLIAFIGWYNPGNLIVKKLVAIREPMPVIEAVQTFATPPADDLVKEAVATEENDEPVEQLKKETGCPGQKDPYKKLKQLIELTTDAKLAVLSKQLDAIPEQMAGFVNEVEVADYTMNEGTPVPPAPPLPPAQQVFPYVPGTSFYFQAIEDTSLPKKYVMTDADVKAKAALEKSMEALQQVDWKKLEGSLKAQGMKVNIDQIQLEIQKAMLQVDWKKLNAESQNAQDEANQEIEKMQQTYAVRVGDFQRAQTVRAERLKLAQQKILMDRLQQCEDVKQMEEDKMKVKEDKKKELSKHPVKRKRIVQI
jgi:beta-lactamase regulating signal transducer with metallopeptidase domain